MKEAKLATYNRARTRVETRQVIADMTERSIDDLVAIAVPYSSHAYEQAIIRAGGVAVPIEGSSP